MDKDICCPRLDPKKWDNKTFTWTKKRFIKDKVFTLFYMPMNFGKVMTRTTKKIDDAKANMPDGLCLAEHTSKWNMNIYLAVDKRIPDADNVTISGKFLSKVYEGPFSDTGKWCDDYKAYAKRKKLDIETWYMWYTTCPKCAKKYGKNYVVIVGKIR